MRKKIDIKNNRLDGYNEISIIGNISDYDSEYICDSINNLITDEGKTSKKLRLNINSFGGDVFGGFSIISSMQKFMDAGGLIETVNEGRADSTAGWIFSCGTRGHRKIMQYAGMFLHPPMFADGRGFEQVLPGSDDYNTLSQYFDKLIDIFVQVTGNSYTKVKNYMENETDFTADKAVKSGFADEKIMVNNAPKFKNGITREQIVNITNSLNIKPIFNEPNNIKMRELAVLLNLNSEASEDAILKEVKKIINAKNKAVSDLQTKTADFERVNTELVNANDKLNVLKDQSIQDYVNKLIEEDNSKKENKDVLINMAKTAGFETFKNLMPLQSSSSNPAIIDTGVNTHIVNNDEKGIKEAKEFQKMNSAEKQALRSSNFTKYSELVNAYEKHFEKLV